MRKNKGRWKCWVAINKERNEIVWFGPSREKVKRYWLDKFGKLWSGVRIARVEVRDS